MQGKYNNKCNAKKMEIVLGDLVRGILLDFALMVAAHWPSNDSLRLWRCDLLVVGRERKSSNHC
jgi:hypothetical protein